MLNITNFKIASALIKLLIYTDRNIDGQSFYVLNVYVLVLVPKMQHSIHKYHLTEMHQISFCNPIAVLYIAICLQYYISLFEQTYQWCRHAGRGLC